MGEAAPAQGGDSTKETPKPQRQSQPRGKGKEGGSKSPPASSASPSVVKQASKETNGHKKESQEPAKETSSGEKVNNSSRKGK